MKKHDDVARTNKLHWEKMVKEGCEFTRPCPHNLSRIIFKMAEEGAKRLFPSSEISFPAEQPVNISNAHHNQH